MLNPFLFIGRGAGADATDCRGRFFSVGGQQKRTGVIPPLWSLGPFFVAGVKSPSITVALGRKDSCR